MPRRQAGDEEQRHSPHPRRGRHRLRHRGERPPLVAGRLPTAASSQFYSFDPSGSTSAVLDNAMSVGLWTAFDGFGSRTASAATTDASACYGSQWGYEYDPDIGLTFCTSRYYDSANARWLTRDPIGYRGGVNLYAYCADNPVMRSDRNGLRWYNPLEWEIGLGTAIKRVVIGTAFVCVADRIYETADTWWTNYKTSDSMRDMLRKWQPVHDDVNWDPLYDLIKNQQGRAAKATGDMGVEAFKQIYK